MNIFMTGPGRLVTHNVHGQGKVYHRDKAQLIDGKIKLHVFFDNGKKLLCDSHNLKFVGFFD